MGDKNLSGAFAAPAKRAFSEESSKPVVYVTAAFPDGASRDLRILDRGFPALFNRLCWLTAEKVSSRQWVITRHHCKMTSQETEPKSEPYVFEGERLSNGEVIRALSAWTRSQKHAAVPGLTESLYPEAQKVTVAARRSYSYKARNYRHG